ncbi:MAG: radical SAM protein [Elusimicrobia bacterium]|nr:radical SAM protein [Elusimicrobiota bacterium]
MHYHQLRNAIFPFLKGRAPGQLVIQITDRCNATCLQCGMRATEPFKRSSLTLDQVKKIIDTAAQQGIQALSFTGGEPFLNTDFLFAAIDHAGKAGIPYIRTGTNGYFFCYHSDESRFRRNVNSIIERMAKTSLRNFWISIDSSIPDVHENMRSLPGVINGIKKALPLFHEAGIYPSANLGINRNVGGDKTYSLLEDQFKTEQDYLKAFTRIYHKAFTDFYRFVIHLGFTTVNTCYPMSLDPTHGDLSAVYAATSPQRIINYTSHEKAALFTTLIDVIKNFRDDIRIFSPLCSLYNLSLDHLNDAKISYPCLGGVDFFFIDSKSTSTYPCGYRGQDNFGEFSALKWKRKSVHAFCKQCDWECFRDPSELFGPLFEFCKNPLVLFSNIKKDPQFYRYWYNDILYYFKCDFFNGRKQPKNYSASKPPVEPLSQPAEEPQEIPVR